MPKKSESMRGIPTNTAPIAAVDSPIPAPSTNSGRRILGQSVRAILLLFFWYVSCFFLMMDCRFPATDPELGTDVGGSFYILAPSVRTAGDLTIYGPSSCWANWLFYPLDQSVRLVQNAMGLAYFVKYRGTVEILTLVVFVLNLLLPSFSVLFRRDQSLKRNGIQVILALAAAGWYWGLIALFDAVDVGAVSVFLSKSLMVIGTILALSALYWIASNRSWLFAVPLAFATMCATIWIIMFLPTTGGGAHFTLQVLWEYGLG